MFDREYEIQTSDYLSHFWIDFAKERPKSDGSYLVMTQLGSVWIGEYDTEKGKFENFYHGEVVRYMPLPGKPKGD